MPWWRSAAAPCGGGVLSLSGLAQAAGVLVLCFDLATPGRAAHAAARHHGVLATYADGPPPLVLSAADLERLADGDTLLRDFRVGKDPRRLAIVRVRAPAETVWSVLRDFVDQFKQGKTPDPRSAQKKKDAAKA